MRLPSPARQSHVGAPQRGLQSALERDVDDSASSSTRFAHESAAGREPTAADQRRLDPRLLESAPLPAVPSTCSRCHPTDDSGPRAATSSSSWLQLFLAQTLSQTLSLQPCAFRRGRCKKMKRTPGRYVHEIVVVGAGLPRPSPQRSLRSAFQSSAPGTGIQPISV